MFIYKSFIAIGKPIFKDEEIRVGGDYAWQIPAYKHILEEVVK